mgnify:CR=1 FL=1
MRPRRRRMAGTHRGDRARHPQGRWGRTAALLVDANSGFSPARAIAVGRLAGGRGRRRHYEEPCPYWELEQTKQVTDALTRGRHRRRAGLRARDLAAHLRAARGRYRAAGRALCRRHRSHAMQRCPHGAGARPAGHARTPPISGLVTLFTMHLLPAAAQRRQVSRILDRGGRLLSWQYGSVPQRPLQSRGGLRDGSRRARLGRGDRPGVAGPLRLSGERSFLTY